MFPPIVHSGRGWDLLPIHISPPNNYKLTAAIYRSRCVRVAARQRSRRIRVDERYTSSIVRKRDHYGT